MVSDEAAGANEAKSEPGAAGGPTDSAAGREYVVVARRYRPQGFDELIGQQQVTQALCNAIATQRVGHAYLFTGARGVGKTSTARILSKALNCVTGPTATPCNKCDICESVSAGEDVDVLEIDGASNRGIDEIRQLRANANVRPSRARFKVYIIDEVHMLTREAFNALLKTLEEPPDHVKFIFCTTDPEKIPITVLSRCQRFDFPPVGTGAIVNRLRHIVTAEGTDADEDALALLARRAAGSMRDSQSLLEQLLSFCDGRITVDDVHAMLGTARSERVTGLVSRLVARDAGAALAELDEALREGVNVGQLAEQLLGHVRDLLALSVGCAADLLLHNPESDCERLRQDAASWGTHNLLAVAQILDQAVARMRQSVDARVLLEMAVIRIASLADLQGLADLLAQARSGVPLQVTENASSEPKKKRNSDESHLTSGSHTTGSQTTSSHPPGPTPTAAPTTAAPATADPPGSHDRPNNVVANSTPVAAPGGAAHTATDGDPRLATADDATGAATAAATAANGNLREVTSGNVEQIWKEALGELDGVVADFAAQYRTVHWGASQQLVVTFPAAYSSAKSYCDRPEPMSKLEQAIRTVTGRTIRIDLRAEEGGPRAKPVKPHGQSSRELVRKSYNHPFVKQALEIFEGEVVRVQPPRG